MVERATVYILPILNVDGYMRGEKIYNLRDLRLDNAFPRPYIDEEYPFAGLDQTASEAQLLMHWVKSRNFVLVGNFYGNGLLAPDLTEAAIHISYPYRARDAHFKTPRPPGHLFLLTTRPCPLLLPGWSLCRGARGAH